MSLDDTTGLLDGQDEKDLKRHRETLKEEVDHMTAFKASYKAKRSAVVTASASGKGNRKTSVKEKQVRLATGGKKYPDLPKQGEITHAKAKSLCPPEGSIWRATRAGAWEAHYEPFRRISRAWNKYGERLACVICLQYLWEHHLEKHGLDLAMCPVGGLFSVDGAEAGDIVAALGADLDGPNQASGSNQ